MKELAKLLTLLLACSAMLCLSSCRGDDEDAYEIVGTWKGEYFSLYASSPVECTLEVRKDCTYSYIVEYSTGPSSGSDTWRYEPATHTWHLSGGTLSGFYQLVDGKLMSGKNVFTRSGEIGDNTDKYAGKDFVGTWQGSEGSNEFLIRLDADGTYTDWLVQDGQNKFKETGEYTVTDNILTVPGECNLVYAWLNRPFTMSFSGKNQMTLVNSSMTTHKTKLVLNRK